MAAVSAKRLEPFFMHISPTNSLKLAAMSVGRHEALISTLYHGYAEGGSSVRDELIRR